MIITSKILHNVSLTAHPQGCARHTLDQIDWVRSLSQHLPSASLLPKRVLVLGGSTGYGLSSRIVTAFAGHAATLNVSFEREPSENKTATPGWYNTLAFEQEAAKEGLVAASVFGDAFSQEIKARVASRIKDLMGQVDLVVYSLASPMRTDPFTGEVYRSVLKPIGQPYTALSVDTSTGIVHSVTVEPAERKQIDDTVKVMGGEDWRLWISYLLEQGLLARGAMTVSYTYIGPQVTYPVYREGTIGKAKEDLEHSAAVLDGYLAAIGGKAYVSVNKALVTRASAVIPVVPLYMAILYRVMKDLGLHEQCTEQMYRLFTGKLYTGQPVPVDSENRIRLDDWEMRADVQREVMERWNSLEEGALLTCGDLEGFRCEYDHIHGFGFDSIDYLADVDPRMV